MCIHDEQSAHGFEKFMRASPKDYADAAVVIMRSARTHKFVAGWAADATNSQRVANTIRDVRGWHRTPMYADLRYVNELRINRGLPVLDREALPMPTGEAHPEFEEKRSTPAQDMLRTALETSAYLKSQEKIDATV